MPEYLKRLPPKQCLPKMISWLSHKFSGSKSHDQIVAIAAGECGVSRKNDIGLDSGVRAALHLAHYKEKYPHLSLHENLSKAYHKIMMVDLMVEDMLENGSEGTMDECLLDIAMDFELMLEEDTISVRETKNYIRKRQFEPSQCEAGTYRTFTLSSGKKAVGCKVKGKFKVQSILEKKKKSDLTEDQSPLEECTGRGYTEEECFKFFNKGRQKGIESEISYSGEGLEKLNEYGQETLKEMIKEASLLPKKIRKNLKIKIYNSFEKILPWDLETNDTWLGFWNNKRQEIGFAADKLNATSKRYARSSMLHEIGHKLYDLLPRYQREYVGDQYWKFKTQLEQSRDPHDNYVAKSASEYFADMFARVNETKKGTGSRFYGESYFKEMLKDYKRNREDFIADTISKILFIRKNYKDRWFFGFRTIQKTDMTEDAERGVGRPRLRGLKAGTPGAMVSGAKRTTVGQSLKEQGVPLSVEGPESVTLPFKILNTETGELVEGEMVENLDKGTAQMQPVSSSNVRSAGQAQNELVVAFHSTGEGKFYRFKFATPEMATEARQALQDSPSPGRWIWHNIRGHVAGESVSPTKIGPAITSGKPTIGGTSASLVQYSTSSTAPSRVAGYKSAYERLKREQSSPTTDPSTGARIEGLLGARKGFRELGRKIRQDFNTCDYTMTGMLTRSGEFDYTAEGQGIKIKTPENLRWVVKNTNHFPVFGKKDYGSHKESDYSLIGFGHNLEYIAPGKVDDHAHVKGDVELFYDINDLSDLEDPSELPVSFGFDDAGNGRVQDIVKIHHLAVSLNKLEKDRCSTRNGSACTISRKLDMIFELIKPLPKIKVSL